jgi:GNAT superfamily N-acetyltransferase
MNDSLRLLPISQVPQFSDQPLAWSLKLWATGREEFSEQDWHEFYANTKKSDYQNWDLAGTDQELLFLAMTNLAGKQAVVASIGLCDFDDFEELRKYKPWIVAFVVREDLRGSGIGSQVLKLMERKALMYGISLVYLWTEGARQFYENRGYIYVETLTKPGRKIEVLKKELSRS